MACASEVGVGNVDGLLSERRVPADRHQRQWTALRDSAAHAEPLSDDAARQPGEATPLLGLQAPRILPRSTPTHLPGTPPPPLTSVEESCRIAVSVL